MADPWDKYAKKPWEKYKPSDGPKFAPNGVPMNAAAKAELAMKAKTGALASSSKQDGIDLGTEKSVMDRGALHAMVQGAGQGVTFGFGDEIVAGVLAAMTDMEYDQALKAARGEVEAARFTRPNTMMTAEIGGALALPLGVMKSTGKLGMDIIKGSATGAGLSSLYGAGNAEGGLANRAEAALDAAKYGAVIGGAIPVAGAGLQKLLNRRAVSKAMAVDAKSAPSGDQLRANAGAVFQKADDSGANLSSPAFSQKVQEALANAQRGGMSPANGMLAPTAPKSLTAATAMEDVATRPQGFGFRDMDTARNMAQAAAGSADKFDAQIGTGLVKGIDEAFGATTPKMAAEVKDARDMWGKLRRSEKIEEAIRRAELHPSGFAQGIMTEMRGILRDPKKLRGFSAIEKEAMKRLTNRISPTSVLNVLGKMGPRLSGNGNIMGTAMSTAGGAAALGPIGALAAPAVGLGARLLGDRSSAKKAEMVRALVATGRKGALPVASSEKRWLAELIGQRSAASQQ